MGKNKFYFGFLAVFLILFYTFGASLIYFIAILSLINIIIFYLLYKNSIGRKEYLNIFKDKNKIHFYLSDDLLCTIPHDKEKSFNETIKDFISNNINYLKDYNISNIFFINFKNDKLENHLNNYFVGE